VNQFKETDQAERQAEECHHDQQADDVHTEQTPQTGSFQIVSKQFQTAIASKGLSF
jgi:hypothetical protein